VDKQATNDAEKVRFIHGFLGLSVVNEKQWILVGRQKKENPAVQKIISNE
jgi:hypothetical protein